ncbi:alpha/beta hydrolase [Mycolicibacterium fortuitum]|uniref:Alpha/beta-hydrolase family protein n=2 Tax=Mycolicibacterium fortuitum TaxID=1766 RepID=A0AAE4VE81_MYCFO|nr:alpha/beta-hydrolase family protein [Mycolicibacterium fortuitum]MCV7138250.1 alpha/beta-hydrolase family protein [Mycolicibacterium fortuitum]MDV7189959.1 alpha/beta-hydrolase family protein [Mycolicibacterium fortuitum]MDV7205918.1 alpha/beta-hydrolase family protein [Mycolicibacterium fortuitum]MDV7226200.1 alpha/beta-hydrolase family protein [Mycolicibacterium fortuitum]MDV7258690.1 alpha/beta-hydrolase family protein [Mycolicibacterium fortuitum]
MTETAEPEADALEVPPGEADKPVWWARHYTFFGTAVGLVFVWFSLTPSLLPRGPLFQGLVSGAAGATGYGIGVFGVWLVRYMRSVETSPRAPKWAWLSLLVIGVIGQVLMIIYFHVWQDEIRDFMGVPRLTFWDHPLTAVLSLVALFAFVEVGQLIRRLVRYLDLKLDRFLPPRVSAVVVVALLLALSIALLNGVVVRVAMSTINRTFAAVNDETDPDFAAPTSVLRSGGPQSLASWESLGHQGRVFVSAGPTVQQLSRFSGKPAVEPIRAYAGLHSADGIKATAALAARELQRTGGLNRAVVAVATTTGTGWINEAEASALEYMYNGNTAIVSMQYSFLPSWLSFLVDQENARQAGQALFEAVDALVRAMPEDKRPKLVVFGESLGSFGGEAPFLSLNNLVARTDGALFSGPTFKNTIWTTLTRERDAGSPEWLPIYDDGQNVRFVAKAENLNRPDAQWGHPRAVYLQHASDPISWWTPDLLFAKPDWLREPRGYDVSRRMEWIPVVTFLQVSADMAVAVDVPDGHGHVYVQNVADAWAAVLQPPGWTPEMTAKLRPMLSSNENA